MDRYGARLIINRAHVFIHVLHIFFFKLIEILLRVYLSNNSFICDSRQRILAAVSPVKYECI